MRTLQAESFNPLYAQLMKQLQQDIQRGLYQVGTRIPPEHELEMNYGVSRVTVRRALQELTAEGLLERKQGKGTFVAAPKNRSQQRQIRSFHEACRDAGKVPGTRTIRVRETAAETRDITELQLSEGDKIVECVRLRLANGEPVILENNHFSLAYSYLESTDLNGSLYRLLQDYGIRAENTTYEISQKQVSGEEAKLLGVEEGSLLLQVRQVVYDQRGRPLHNSLQLIRGDRFTLVI